MSQKEKFEQTTEFNSEEAAKYLERLASGIRAGTMSFEDAGTTVTLDMGEVISIKLEAEADPKKGKGSLEVEISWRASKAPVEGEKEEAESVTRG